MLQEADYDLKTDANAGLLVTFYSYTSKDDERTRAEGRPCFKNVDYVRIEIPGDRSTVIDRPASDFDKRRFSRQYRAYTENREQVDDGTPLTEWPAIDKAIIEELRFFKIRTVEQLASVSDVNAQSMPGLHTLRDKAKAYLELIKGNAPFEKMQAELTSRDAKIQVLEQQIALLTKKLDELADE